MKKKFFLVFMLSVSLGVIISGVLSINLLRSNYEDSVRNNLVENANIIKVLLEENEDEKWKYSFIETIQEKMNARITLINNTGEVILDTEISKEELDNHMERPEVITAFNGNIGIEKRFSSTLEKEMYYVAIPIINDNIQIVRLSVPLKNIDEYSETVVLKVGIATVIGAILASMLGMRFLNMFTVPLDILNKATRNIANGNFGEQVYINSSDEIGELADSFNFMSVELENRITELKESNDTNRVILKSMINGVIAIGNDNKILFVNKAFQNMFDIDEESIKNSDIREVFKDHILEKIFYSEFNIFSEVESELEVNFPKHNAYSIFSNLIKDSEKKNGTMGLLMSFVDITQMRNLENMRKDFVANVSHELKTPLTSIQGFIETLKDGAAEKKEIRDKFINIIDIEANRLKLLIDDLLLLSDIEKNSRSKSRCSYIDLYETVDEIKDMMEHISLRRNIKIEYDIEKGTKAIYGNRTWLKQMLINLIDNGIKYSYEGGNILVAIYDKRDNTIISVKDNGIGIEKEHIDRLFERFYRVDKARSKKVGGTGLGLAIVKHIVYSLNGEIIVNSEIGVGTEFIIEIPNINQKFVNIEFS